ncbi:MAG TPA: VCBS repeat-containing protein [Pirellulales bacterium]|jgi:G:T-mismatch repair DNA endonuclease (very short patch repair protein)|nr:VCBS repeat-containing protein [Pirellulales bacterium]
MFRGRFPIALITGVWLAFALPRGSWLAETAQAEVPQFHVQEVDTGLGIGYAVRVDDINDDGKPDIVVVDTDRIVWYENPSWKKHVLTEGQTKRDNVCFSAADVEGKGQLAYALGADWRPFATKDGGSIQWVRRGAKPDDPWTVYPIAEEPTVHRMQWADLNETGRPQLIVLPLMGRNTMTPNWDETPVRMLSFTIPKDPTRDRWVPEVINAEMHVTHNFTVTDLDHDGHPDLVVASAEGINFLKRSAEGKWKRTLIGAGNQASRPARGASEIKRGRLADGSDYLASIEPWHGYQVVVYTPPPDARNPAEAVQKEWSRQVLDEDLKWGHAVWCAKLAGHQDQLIVGVRDNKDAEHRCGLRIYDPDQSRPAKWTKHVIDPGGVAIEDLTAADLNGDGRLDIVAVGRATKNVRIYWNDGVK